MMVSKCFGNDGPVLIEEERECPVDGAISRESCEEADVGIGVDCQFYLSACHQQYISIEC
jgi:hypothetical protein